MTTSLQTSTPEIHEYGTQNCTFDCRRTCRCCGSSMSYNDRKEADEFQAGLDVCPSCILHFRNRSCLDGNI